MLLGKIKESMSFISHGLNYLVGVPPDVHKKSQKTASALVRVGAVLGPLIQVIFVIIDNSGSMSFSDCKPSRIDAAKKAVKQFCTKRSELSPHDMIVLIGFNTRATVYMKANAITDTAKITKSLRKMKAEGGTNLIAGLKAAQRIIGNNPDPSINYRILLLTDGHGGDPYSIACKLKSQGVLLEVIGIGGDPLAVNSQILKSIATTDKDGFTHYWFIRNTDSLVRKYEQLATGLVFRSEDNDHQAGV